MSLSLNEGLNGEISGRPSNETLPSFDIPNSGRPSIELSNRLDNEVVDRGTSRYFILAIALLCSVWSAGLIFGWAPLYSTLLRAGVYADRCPESIIPNDTSISFMHAFNVTEVPTTSGAYTSPLCEAQQQRLILIYTAGSAFTQASLFVSGVFLDFQGPKLTASLSSLVVAVGSFLFGAASLYKLDLYIFGFALMGFGGAGINLATYTVSNLFPRYKSWVVSSLVGVWTLSSLWFLLIRPAFNSGISLHAIFFAQSALLLATAFVFFFTFPNRALREGERFSFHQWLPWNAWSHKEHHSVHSIDSPSFNHDEFQLEDLKGNHTRRHSNFGSSIPSIDSSASLSDSGHEIQDSKGPEGLLVLDLDRSNLPNASNLVENSESFPAKNLERSGTSYGKSEASSEMIELETRETPSAPARSGVDPEAHSTFRAILADLMTVDFILLTFWFAVHVLFFEFFIGTIADSLDYRTRQTKWPTGPADLPSSQALSTKADHYVLAFNLIYAIGFVFVPIYAWTTDRLGFTGSFLLATLLALFYPLASALIPSLWLSQAASYVLYSAALQFVYSCQFGFVSHRFGYNHFGVLVGIMGLVAAALIPLQPVFLRLVLSKFDGNFFFMYIIQGALTLPLFAIVIWNWISSKRALILGNSAP